MKFNKETLAGAVFVVFRVLLWLPVLAAAAFFGAALGDLLVFFAAEHLSPAAVGILAGLLTLAVVRSKTPLYTPFERMEQFKQKHHLDRRHILFGHQPPAEYDEQNRQKPWIYVIQLILQIEINFAGSISQLECS